MNRTPADEGITAAKSQHTRTFGPDRIELTTWKGEQNRKVLAYAPCSCGCDYRNGHLGWAGYLSGSDAEGNGFTLWIESRATFLALAVEINR